MEWKTTESTNEYIIDHIAIENSFEFKKWQNTLKDTYGIELFKSQETETQFAMLNIFRNSLAHSGGQYNSRINREANKLFPNEVNKEYKELFEVSRMEIFDEKIYYHLLNATKEIILNIEKKIYG